MNSDNSFKHLISKERVVNNTNLSTGVHAIWPQWANLRHIRALFGPVGNVQRSRGSSILATHALFYYTSKEWNELQEIARDLYKDKLGRAILASPEFLQQDNLDLPSHPDVDRQKVISELLQSCSTQTLGEKDQRLWQDAMQDRSFQKIKFESWQAKSLSFNQCKMNDIIFRNCDFVNCRIVANEWKNIVFDKSSLGFEFYNCILDGVEFKDMHHSLKQSLEFVDSQALNWRGKNAYFSNSTFKNSHLENWSFDQSSFKSSVFLNTSAQKFKLSRCRLQDNGWQNCEIDDVHYDYCDINKEMMVKVKSQGYLITRSTLSNSQLICCEFDQAPIAIWHDREDDECSFAQTIISDCSIHEMPLQDEKQAFATGKPKPGITVTHDSSYNF